MKQKTLPVLILAIGATAVFLRMWTANPTVATVERTTDPHALFRIVRRAGSAPVRQAALEKLSDEALLTRLATASPRRDVRERAIRKLTDQQLLWHLASHEKDSILREAAASVLTNQALLTQLLLNTGDQRVLLAAADRLSDPAAIANVVVKLTSWSADLELQERLVRRLDDQAALATVAANAWHRPARLAALQKITNSAALVQFAGDPDLGTTAIDQMTDPVALAAVAREALQPRTRLAAIQRISDPERLLDLARNAPDTASARAATARIREPAALGKLALESQDQAVRQDALTRLSGLGNLEFAQVLAAAAPGNAAAAQMASALASLPIGDRARIGAAILPSFRVMNLPAVLEEIGELDSARIACEPLQETYTLVPGTAHQQLFADDSRLYEAAGERLTCSLSFKRLSNPLLVSWQTRFPTHASGSSQLSTICFFPAPVSATDIVETLCARLSQPLLASIAAGCNDPFVRQAAVRRLLDRPLLQALSTNDTDASVRQAATARLGSLP